MNTATTTLRIGVLQAADYAALDAANTQAARLEWGELPTLVVSGPDRASWLNGLLTCDVSEVRPGVGAWGLLLDRLGKIQAVLGVLADSERLYLGVLWGDVDAVTKELDARLVMEDAELEHSKEAAYWRLRLGVSLPNSEPDAQASGAITLAGRGLLSIAFGAPLSADRALELSSEAWTLFRIKHGLSWGGVDFDNGERPHEAALERRAVSWSKGCYLGQEVVCMQDMRGKVKRSVRPFYVFAETGPDSDATSSEVVMDTKSVGRVTSAVYDPRGGRYWVLAQVPLAAVPASSADAVRADLVTELSWPGAATVDSRLRPVEPALGLAE